MSSDEWDDGTLSASFDDYVPPASTHDDDASFDLRKMLREPMFLYSVVLGGWLVVRWINKFLSWRAAPLDSLRERWPGFDTVELQKFLSEHRGDAEAAGATIQLQVLDGTLPELLEVVISKGVDDRLGLVLGARESSSDLPFVAEAVPGSLAEGLVRVGDMLCRINGSSPIEGVPEARRIIAETSGMMVLQLHRRRKGANAPSAAAAGAGATGERAALRQRAARGSGSWEPPENAPLD
jgi:hypothetical protein